MKTAAFRFFFTIFLFIIGHWLFGSFSRLGKSSAYPSRSTSSVFAMAGTSPKPANPGHNDDTDQNSDTGQNNDTGHNKIKLPVPRCQGSISVEEAIKLRRTRRSFLTAPLSKQQLSQILWAAMGITEEGGEKRSVPSAGALNPLDIFIVVGKKGITQMEEGVYHYHPTDHQLIRVGSRDLRKQIAEGALGQSWISQTPVVIVITGEYVRTTRKYGERGIRYVHMEAGHVAQNIFLQSVALELGAGIVGAFDDEKIKSGMNLPDNYNPLLIMPVGKVK
ncbi:MAG: SagB/ThcOx family dehydrogenase [bacterium]